MRDFKKYAEDGKKKMPRSYEMSGKEMKMLNDMAAESREGFWSALFMAYNAGFEAGIRFAKRQKEGAA